MFGCAFPVCMLDVLLLADLLVSGSEEYCRRQMVYESPNISQSSSIIKT